MKSVEVGGLPFDMRPAAPDFGRVAARTYRAPLDAEGVAVLPAAWNDWDD